MIRTGHILTKIFYLYTLNKGLMPKKKNFYDRLCQNA